jgi:hypothetical protein
VVDLESDLETCVSRVGRDFYGFDFPDVAGQAILNVFYAIIYIFSRSLGEHFDGAVREVADVAGQLVAAGHPVGGEAKTHALDPAGEDYVLCNHVRLTIFYLLLTIGLRAVTVIC